MLIFGEYKSCTSVLKTFYFVPNTRLFWHNDVPHSTGITKETFQCNYSITFLIVRTYHLMTSIYLNPRKEALGEASLSD